MVLKMVDAGFVVGKDIFGLSAAIGKISRAQIKTKNIRVRKTRSFPP
jgi:hypothetical protein